MKDASAPVPLVIHASHEAGAKIGGIGAMLEGLLQSNTYNIGVKRTMLVGPMFGWDSMLMERLNSPENQLTIRYSSLHGVFDNVEPHIRDALQKVEESYRVALLYGTRRFGEREHEVLLVDVSNPDPDYIAQFKYHVWEHYGIDCARYSHDPEFNLYMAIAQPLYAALKALKVDEGLAPDERIIIAHEWLGMPVVFAAQMNEPGHWRTVFYAHEMATARLLVESHSGHDTRFYNAMFKAEEQHMDLETVFGDQSYFFKHAIIRQAIRCDNIFAVGGLVVHELRFLGGDFTDTNIDVVYNGLVSRDITIDERVESKRRLQQYAKNLLGFRPDFVFTHVTRMVLSKGLWRDLKVMEHLDELLWQEGKTAVLFVLSTSVPAGRSPELVRQWEAEYGWPVGHRADTGDLVGDEIAFFFNGVEPFNRSAKACRVVLVNQFGWDQERCGLRMPPEMGFPDIRQGTDLEFGQSIYEPFGISQIEPLNFGALSCVSNVCGCISFVESVAEDIGGPTNLVIADYVTVPEEFPIKTPFDALDIDWGVRDWVETENSATAAREILNKLPRSRKAMQKMLEDGAALAHRMSWDVVAERFFLPGLEKARKNHG